MFRQARLKWREPDELSKKQRYFTKEVPTKMLKIAREKRTALIYDALLVDEAQDHDTRMTPQSRNATGAGWWEVYWCLLQQGANAPMAMFYDPGQRPLFREPAAFDVNRLRQRLPQGRCTSGSLTPCATRAQSINS
jgi:hypothetical protein